MAANTVNKVTYGDKVLVDLTSDTVTAGNMLSGITAHDKSGAIVTGTISSKTSSNLTASGATVTVPAGYYASNASKSVTTATQVTPSISISSTGLITASATQTAGYVSAGTKSSTKQMTTVGATTYTPTTSNQTIASGTYLTGAQTISGDEDLIAENIKSGVDIFGVEGTFTSDATATASAMLSGKTAYVNGAKVTGNIATKTSSDLTASGATVSAPAGYYASSVSKSVATATQATPSISVSSDGIITASSTQSAGYVSAGTKSSTKQLTTKAKTTYTPTTSNQTIASGTYLTGAQTISGDANLVASNIKSGTSIFGVSGTYTSDATAAASEILSGEIAYVAGEKVTGTMTNNGAVSKSITPSTSSQSYTIPAGYHNGSGKVTVAAAPTSLIDGDATAANVLSGKTFFVDSYTKKTGTMTNNGAVSKTITPSSSTQTYTIPAGYHNGSGKVTVEAALSNYEGYIVKTGTLQSYSVSTKNSNRTITFPTGIIPLSLSIDLKFGSINSESHRRFTIDGLFYAAHGGLNGIANSSFVQSDIDLESYYESISSIPSSLTYYGWSTEANREVLGTISIKKWLEPIS